MSKISMDKVKSSVSHGDMKNYKSMVLELMKDFHDFLKSHGIKYSLAFGTLLGAIRHNGYIPWDDDIDIILTGEEFQKLLAIVDEFNSDKYLVVKPLDDNPLGIARILKIYDKRACMKEYGVVPFDGPFIDVFSTIDVKNKESYAKEANKFRLYTTFYSFKTGRLSVSSYKSIGGHSHIIKILSYLYSKKSLKKKIDEYYKNRESKWCFSSFGSPKLYEKTWFEDCELHKFEEYEFYITTKYDAMLKADFGDYMKLPPVDERNPRHLIEISFNESFMDKNKKI